MAKREAPEINAGSMADIAFLLLIFFLVTTTMDKDTAYLRKIPKKIDIPEDEVPKIEEKNVYRITINDKQAIKVKNDSILPSAEMENLHNRIRHFYLVNRGLKTDRNLNYPYYSYATSSFIRQKIDESYDLVDRANGLPDTDPNKESQVEYADKTVTEWENKLAVYLNYEKAAGKGKEMPEIDQQAHIKLEPFIGTDYAAYVAIQSEIQRALIGMRNEEATELFGMSYSAMLQYYNQNELEPTPLVKQYKDRIDLLETLFPERIIEVKPKQ